MTIAIQEKHNRIEIERRLGELQGLSSRLIAALSEVKANLSSVSKPIFTAVACQAAA